MQPGQLSDSEMRDVAEREDVSSMQKGLSCATFTTTDWSVYKSVLMSSDWEVVTRSDNEYEFLVFT